MTNARDETGPGALAQARWLSRGIAVAALAAGLKNPHGAPARRAQDAITLGALALGMPHGAADTELLRVAAGGSRHRQLILIAGYAAAAAAATGVIRRGGSRMSQAVLAASAIHFAEGELAGWHSPARSGTHRLLRGAAAAFSTVLLPAAVTSVNRSLGGTAGGAGVGKVGDARSGTAGAAKDGEASGKPSSGLRLLGDPATRTPALLGTTALTAALSAALLVRGDREAGLDTALLGAVAAVTPPAVGFAAYFGGWHSVRHTARVIDSLRGRGVLPAETRLAGGTALLTRRSGWAAAVGITAAAALVAIDPAHASDNAFAAVLGLTVPHMTTVAAVLARGSAPD